LQQDHPDSKKLVQLGKKRPGELLAKFQQTKKASVQQESDWATDKKKKKRVGRKPVPSPSEKKTGNSTTGFLKMGGAKSW